MLMWRASGPVYASLGGPIARVAVGVQVADWRSTHRDPPVVDAIVEGLELLHRLEPLRVGRFRREMPRVILLDVLRGPAVAGFAPGARACYLDGRFLAGAPAGTRPALVALLLVHEATHARLDRLRPLPWPRSVVHRIERVCLRQELVFAARLPVPPYGGFRRWVADKARTDPAADARLLEAARALAAA